MSTAAAPSASTSAPVDALKSSLDLANKAFALRKYEEAAEHYTVTLELFAEKFGDAHPSAAPLLLMYGKTLLELAIAQNQVMQQDGAGQADGADDDQGGDDPDGQNEDDKAQLAKNIISELTDISQDDDSTSTPQAASASTSKVASPAPAGADQPDEGDVMEDPEDDFNAAWEVLDTARRLFGEMTTGKARLQEADCLLTLGDISLETENFPQAVEDFTSALSLKTSLLPSSSRQISEAHLKLGMALEFDPTEGSRPLALEHLVKAKDVLLLRKTELDNGASGWVVAGAGAGKGKGKSSGEEIEAGLVNDRVEDLSAEERTAEGKDIEELVQDLDSKIEDLRTAPLPSTTLPDLLPTKASQAFAPASAGSSSAPVNDLSSMVKKKKVVAPAPASASNGAAEKRKGSDEQEADAAVKKARTA